MSAQAKSLLLDNCAISACVDCGGWNAVTKRFLVETVREVEIEATTGYQHREIIEPREFRSVVQVHDVNLEARFEAEERFPKLATLDPGERDLWIHALARDDAWILCGPDIASVKFGVMAGFADRLISMEELFQSVGFQPKRKLRISETRKWLKAVIDEMKLELAFTNKG